MKSQQVKPTEGEMEILQILWKYGPCTVKEVNYLMNEKKDVGYTTSLKMLQIMYEKGLVSRQPVGKGHRYNAILKERLVKKNLVRGMIDLVFEGSPMQMVLQALGNYKASPEELRDLKQLIHEMEKRGKR